MTHHNIEKKLAFGTVQNFHQIADTFFPNVQGVLPRRTGAHVFTVTGETTFFPHSLVDEILQFLYRLRFSIFAAGQYLRAVVNSYDSVRRIDEKAGPATRKFDALNGGIARSALRNFVGRPDGQSFGVEDQYSTSSVTGEDVATSTIERRYDI